MKFGSWLEVHLPPRSPGILNRLLEVLSDDVKPLLVLGNLCGLPPKFRQFFPPGRQQHPQKTGFVNGRVRNADVVAHKLGDHKFSLQERGQSQRVNLHWSQDSQPGCANRAILMRPNDSDRPALWPDG
jgi:hypothetical protein